ncbi:MAG: type IV toxin-antitoxin system AbiEi family antitoxin domain-containing protein [Bifidobacterium crudilactis]|uniref:type IV toxin-antitoxin system AbiEi family antitoxin domain-containing protein n=1 Tax=Bifidobacterium crudilactis TaxID=327277 RepID=UPI003F958DB2
MSKVATLSALTSGQWGMVTTAQAKMLGVSRLDMSRLERSGAMERLAHGVYKDAGVPSDSFEGIRAAWLSIEPKRTAEERLRDVPDEAVVCLESAAWMLNAGDFVPEPYRFSTPRRRQTQREDLKLRTRRYPEESVRIVNGLPVTTFEQTVVDLVEAGTDLSLIQDMFVHSKYGYLRHIDLDRFDARLAPFAKRYGFTPGDGIGLRRQLMEPFNESIVKAFNRVIPHIADSLKSFNEPSRQMFEVARHAGDALASLEQWARLSNESMSRIARSAAMVNVANAIHSVDGKPQEVSKLDERPKS